MDIERIEASERIELQHKPDAVEEHGPEGIEALCKRINCGMGDDFLAGTPEQ